MFVKINICKNIYKKMGNIYFINVVRRLYLYLSDKLSYIYSIK